MVIWSPPPPSSTPPVAAMLVVAAGPGIGLDPIRGLGLGRVLVLVELVVAAGPGVGLRGLGVGRVLVLVELVVADGPGVGLDPSRGRPCLLALGDGEVENADDRLRRVHLLDHALLLQLRQVRLQ